MTDSDFPSDSIPDAEEILANVMGLPEQLSGEPRRQAVPSIAGIVYQAWWSIDAWLRLLDADEVIYLEGAEDFDIVRSDNATTVQIKRNTGSISLGMAKAHEALENFWTLSCKEPNRQIDFHYLTTSSIALEQDSNFDGIKGIEAWRAAKTNPELASNVASYLVSKLNVNSPLRTFLITAPPEVIQDRLIRRFQWLTDQPDIDVVKRSVDDRIAVLLEGRRRSLSLIPTVRRHLESRFWEVVLEPSSERRYLTCGELLLQLDDAITTYIPVPTDQIPDLIGNARPGLGLLNLLLEKTPRPPSPLLRRPELTQHLEQLIKLRKVILLTGTVYKGKSTIAQLVVSTLCPEAWWINLTERGIDQVDNILLALAGKIESGDCPNLIVIDDLDISLSAHRVYRDSLDLVLHRANTSGRGVILTAKGGSNNSAIVQDFNNIELLDVPELNTNETESLCIEYGCPAEIATLWGPFITAWTGGHPKLIQVRIAELVVRNWPRPSSDDITNQSPAVTSVHQMARQLLSESESASIAEFVYLVSECSVLMHRSVAIRLAESVDGVTNAGDVLDKLTGKWLERIEGDWFRVTALLKGVAKEVWSQDKRKRAHIYLYDAILAKQSLIPSEAAALLYHAYIGGEPRRLAFIAMKLQVIEGKDAVLEVQRQLLWLPLIALEEGQSITDNVIAGVTLRSLQFRVASTLDSELLPQICARWADDIERIEQQELKSVNKAMIWMSLGFAENSKVPLKFRLDALLGFPTLPSEFREGIENPGERFFEIADPIDGLPMDGSTNQAIFICAISSVRDLDSLDELMKWLDSTATEEIRKEFDVMLEWHFVQSMGAFFQSAWTAVFEDTKDWKPWLELFERIDEYAIRRTSLRVGREAAKSRAIILTEYLEKSDVAIKVLEQAEADFGVSDVIMEQRSNVLFQTQDDESVLEIWNKMASDPGSLASLDPFARRRAGISAARLEKFDQAGQIFLDAANSIQAGTLDQTKFGLQVDAAFVISLGGNQAAATKVLLDAVLALPVESAVEENGWWESVQRFASEVCRDIENSLWKKIKAEPHFGSASSPELKGIKPEPGQDARSEVTRIQILHLAATVFSKGDCISLYIDAMVSSKYFYVRWHVAEAQLALAYSAGAGEGFIEALLAFDVATEDISIYLQKGMSILEPDDGENSRLPNSPERWSGLLCAGVICSGTGLLSNLKIWLEASIHLLGDKAEFTNTIRLILKGASLPVEKLQVVILGTETSPYVIIGAASRLLQEDLSADKTLQLQILLTSGLVCDNSFSRQALFNRHVARKFSASWCQYLQNSFQFYSPSITIPKLLASLDGLESGSATLKNILESASGSLNHSPGDFMERVF